MSLILYLVAIDDFLLFHGLIYVCKLFLAFSITLQAWIQPGFSLDSVVVTLHLDFVVKDTANFVTTLLSGSGPSTL
jgi:hypothetical protein